MKVLFDARWILVENRFDGVSRYTYELAHALAARDDIEIAWLVYDQRQVDKLPAGEVVWANNPNNILQEVFSLARTVNRSGYKLLYSPFFTVGTFGKRFKLVLTIHDMIYFTHRTPPQWLPWHVRLGWWLFHTTYWPMRWQLNKADIVATVSETAWQELLDAKATKCEIVTVANAAGEGFRKTEDRIQNLEFRNQKLESEKVEVESSDKRVVRESEQQEEIAGDFSQVLNRSDRTRETAMLRAEHALASAGNDASGEDTRYNSNNIVYMGAFTPYKNVECLIDALEFLPEVTLHLCSKIPPARRPSLEKYIADRGVANRVVLYDGATDEQYKSALAGARCAISASRLEGFGLPLIEAQQAGVPFAAADTPIFHEIGQASVLYFSPNSPRECAERIQQFADPEVSKDYIARGYQNAARYTWANSAEIAAKICKKLLPN